MPREGLDPSEIETAVIVLHYLVSHGFAKAVAAFRRDAKQLLKPVRSVPAGIRPLANIILEYVALKEAAIRRDTYLRGNSALREIDEIIARRSECQKTVQELAAQCQRPVEGPSFALGLGDSHGTPEEPDLGDLREPPLGGDDVQECPVESAAADEAAQPRHTPRKLLRKAAPKRKRLVSVQAAPGEAATSASLLDQPVNERMLEQLLAGEWQGRFAEGLASCINSHLGPQGQQDTALSTADMTHLALLPQQQALDDTAMMDWVSALTEEPSMTALLEPIVALEAGSPVARLESGTEGRTNRSSVLLERQQSDTQHDSTSMATAACAHEQLPGRLPGRAADAQPALPPLPSQAQDDAQPIVSQSLHTVRDADTDLRQEEIAQAHLARDTSSADPDITAAGAVERSETGLGSGSPAEYGQVVEDGHDRSESLNNESDSDDDIQVRAMDRTALLSSLVGSGSAEGAIESLVASLKY